MSGTVTIASIGSTGGILTINPTTPAEVGTEYFFTITATLASWPAVTSTSPFKVMITNGCETTNLF